MYSVHKLPGLALKVAKTVGKRGIKAYLFKELRSMPELSFAVHYIGAFAGVVITASHNPLSITGLKCMDKTEDKSRQVLR